MRPRPRILIVDDEVNVARTLQMILEIQGYRVTAAYSGAQAAQLLSSRLRFDAVVTDLNMERADTGLDIARRAAQLQPRPMIMIATGFPDASNLQRALHAHVVDYVIFKPLPVEELLGALRRLLSFRMQAAG